MTMNTIDERIVVLGAGAVGAAAAYHLTRAGEPVLLIEQFAPGHTRGSSRGPARITRHSYADAAYARLMPAAFRAWRALEADAARPLYIRTGGVSFCPPGVDYVSRVSENLAATDVPHRRLTGAAWNAHNAAFELPADYDVVFEPDAGLIASERAVATMLALASERGASLLPWTAARSIDVEGPRIRLSCERIDPATEQPTGETFDVNADRLVVAVGAWIGRLLPEFNQALRPTLQQVRYLKPASDGSHAIGRLPAFIFTGDDRETAYYGLPDFLGGGVKVARHGGPEVDPEAPERTLSAEDHAALRRFLANHLPGLAEAPLLHEETCLYTMAPGERFVIGPLPRRPEVLIASPCSGHGFKFSCLVGEVLADLARDGWTDQEVEAWSSPAEVIAAPLAVAPGELVD
jgi:sarcosine oxidase